MALNVIVETTTGDTVHGLYQKTTVTKSAAVTLNRSAVARGLSAFTPRVNI